MLRRGSAKCRDHNAIVHGIWVAAFEYGIGLWIERVDSDDNIADEPSRKEFGTLHGLGAVEYDPVEKPDTWSVRLTTLGDAVCG